MFGHEPLKINDTGRHLVTMRSRGWWWLVSVVGLVLLSQAKGNGNCSSHDSRGTAGWDVQYDVAFAGHDLAPLTRRTTATASACCKLCECQRD